MISTIQLKSTRKQRGATLFTALVFLGLMTIVGVSASKVSILDILVSGNNQYEMEVFQEADNIMTNLATPTEFIQTWFSEDGETDPWIHEKPANPQKPGLSEQIINRDIMYQCGGFSGLAVSMGPDNRCRMFDFKVDTTKKNSGIRERHVRGAGKEIPKASRNNYNN